MPQAKCSTPQAAARPSSRRRLIATRRALPNRLAAKATGPSNIQFPRRGVVRGAPAVGWVTVQLHYRDETSAQVGRRRGAGERRFAGADARFARHRSRAGDCVLVMRTPPGVEGSLDTDRIADVLVARRIADRVRVNGASQSRTLTRFSPRGRATLSAAAALSRRLKPG